MLMADVFSITLIILGFLLAQQGLWLLSRALWPRRFAAATVRCRRNPVASFFVGLPVTAAVVVLFAVLGNKLGAAGQVAAFAVFVLFWIYANIGTAGLVTHVGETLKSPTDRDRPWAATVRGGVVTELAWLLPIVGWPVLLFASIVLGAGATTLSWFRVKPRSELTAPAEAMSQDMSLPRQPGSVLGEPAEALISGGLSAEGR